MSFWEFAFRDNVLTPALFVLAGLASLFFSRWLNAQMARRPDDANSTSAQTDPRSARLYDIADRFAARGKISWALIVVGVLWLAENLV